MANQNNSDNLTERLADVPKTLPSRWDTPRAGFEKTLARLRAYDEAQSPVGYTSCVSCNCGQDQVSYL